MKSPLKEKSQFFSLLILAITTMVMSAGTVGAQELEARSYANIPIGINFLGVGYQYSSGNVFFDKALPIKGTDGRLSVIAPRYVRSIKLFGKPGKIKAALPFARGHWDGVVADQFRTRDASGLGDAKLGFDLLVSGAPPLTKQNFASYRQRTIVGVTLDVVLPTGNYDPSKIVNIGSNRWAFNPKLAVSQNLAAKWVLEIVGNAWIFTRNTNFAGGLTLDQKNLYALNVHAIHDIRPGFWLSLGVGYGKGGRTTVEGEVRQTMQSNWRFGAFLTYALTPSQGVSVAVLSGVTEGVGADFDAITVGYQYSWGGG